MFDVEVYGDKDGESELREFLRDLNNRAKKGVKDARITLNQIRYCIERIKIDGTRVGEKIAKKIEDDIWEIRPDDYRVMFCVRKHGRFVLLSYFHKDRGKTPHREIERAKRLRDDWISRNP